MLHVVELTAQLANSALYLIPNAILVGAKEPVSAQTVLILEIMRFTAWNVVFFMFVFQARLLNLWLDKDHNPIESEDSIMIDASWKNHWALFCCWCGFESFLVAYGCYQWTVLKGQSYGDDVQSTMGAHTTQLNPCGFPIFLFMSYLLAALCFIQNGCNQLNKRSYAMFRWVNVRLRFHQIQVVLVGGFVLLSFAVFAWPFAGTGNIGTLNLFGLMPAQVMMVTLCALNCHLMFPIILESSDALNTGSDCLSWLDPRDDEESGIIGQSKMASFSFETMVKTWYWSLLAYRCERKDPFIRCDIAKNMYRLSNHFVVKVKGITGIVAWGGSTIVVAFQGTSSLGNLRTDLDTWLAVHPPHRGSIFRGTSPLVHKGFLSGWEASGLKEMVLKKVRAAMDSEGFQISRARVILTGHSMGGALAILAGLDISKECQIPGNKISCYTFGAPRVGNNAFKLEYNRIITDTWQIMNGYDMVPSMPSFGNFFSHVGKRVIINNAGDMIVCPLFVEKSLFRFLHFLNIPTKFGDHLMRNYKKSMEAITRAQFIKWKGLPGGLESMRCLLKDDQEGSVSAVLGLKLSKLEQLHSITSGACQKRFLSLDKISVLSSKDSCSSGRGLDGAQRLCRL